MTLDERGQSNASGKYLVRFAAGGIAALAGRISMAVAEAHGVNKRACLHMKPHECDVMLTSIRLCIRQGHPTDTSYAAH